MPIHGQDWVKQLERLHQATVAVAAAHDVDEALQIIADTAREVLGAEMAAIGVPGVPGEPMAYFVVSGISEDIHQRIGHAPMGRGVLGVLLNDGQSLNIEDIRQHKDYLGVPAYHPHMRSFLGVPVRSGGEVIGDLYLANKLEEDSFTDDDQRIAEMLAAHAAAVIHSLRFHEKQEELAVIREHNRLAPKINDDVLQTLYGAGLLLNNVALEDEEKAKQQIREVQASLDIAIKNLREHLLGLAEANVENYP